MTQSTSLASILEKTEDGCEKCHVDFGGCAVVSEEDKRVHDFKHRTGASAVSSFLSDDVGWTDIELPGVLADLMLFSALSSAKIGDRRSHPQRLQRIKAAMDKRFDDCKFQFVA